MLFDCNDFLFDIHNKVSEKKKKIALYNTFYEK